MTGIGRFYGDRPDRPDRRGRPDQPFPSTNSSLQDRDGVVVCGMSLWLDAKYAGIVGARLRNFKKVRPNHWQFSCPICGDSKKNPRKARGGFYPGKTNLHLYFTCHNECGTMAFYTFLKRFDLALYEEYTRESMASWRALITEPEETPVMKAPNLDIRWWDGLQNLVELSHDHMCRSFVANRCIPYRWWDRLYFVGDWYNWAYHLDPEQPKLSGNYPRLVIAGFDMNRRAIGFQGRKLNEFGGAKYLTVRLNKDRNLAFGLDTISGDYKKIFVMEGPIDAMFVKNGVAAAGSSSMLGLAEEVKEMYPKHEVVLVYDNQPRAKDIINKMLNAAEKGWSIVVWPSFVAEKDINDLILAHLKCIVDHPPSQEEISKACNTIQESLESWVEKGHNAKLATLTWRRVT